jgi:D-sedoheptulose 7-phosphate isomerase
MYLHKKLKDKIETYMRDSANIILESIVLTDTIENIVDIIFNCIMKGNKIVLFGNGGSAADSQHIAAEFVGRFILNRNSIAALSLTTDSSILTAISNDFSSNEIFSRQCESLVYDGDVVIGISTSGNSNNVIEGLKKSKDNGATTIGLLGNFGGKIKDIVDYSIIIPSTSTPKIQEVHRVISHIICKLVEEKYYDEKK